MSKAFFTRPTILGSSALGLCLAASIGLPAAHSKGGGKGRSASITGTVSFKGKAPARKTIDNTSDGFCARTKLASDEVIVAKGKLKDVHVRIKSGTAGKHKAPTSPVVVEQQGCVYAPHVVGVMAGQAVAIKNSDKTMHNVHAYVEGESWFNRSQPKGAPDIVEKDTGKAGEVFELKCNVHPWMHSFLPLTDHPYFDVSAEDGGFAISKVPAGTYTLEAWHPTLGLKTQSIKVGKSGSTKVDFVFP